MKINATKRTKTGTSASKKLRREGLVPAVIYGKDQDSVEITLNRRDFDQIIREVGMNGVFEVAIEDGESFNVFVKDQDKAALKDIIYHVDLLSFKAGEKVTMTIPISITGQENLAEQTVANISLNEIDIEVDPTKAPEEFTLDISELEVGDSLSVADLTVEDDIDVLAEADQTIVSISVVEEEPEEDLDAAAEEMPEPEVITERGDDEEEEEEE